MLKLLQLGTTLAVSFGLFAFSSLGADDHAASEHAKPANTRNETCSGTPTRRIVNPTRTGHETFVGSGPVFPAGVLPARRATMHVRVIDGQLTGKLYFAMRRGMPRNAKAVVTGSVAGEAVRFIAPGRERGTERLVIRRDALRAGRGGERRFVYQQGAIQVAGAGCMTFAIASGQRSWRLKIRVVDMSPRATRPAEIS